VVVNRSGAQAGDAKDLPAFERISSHLVGLTAPRDGRVVHKTGLDDDRVTGLADLFLIGRSCNRDACGTGRQHKPGLRISAWLRANNAGPRFAPGSATGVVATRFDEIRRYRVYQDVFIIESSQQDSASGIESQQRALEFITGFDGATLLPAIQATDWPEQRNGILRSGQTSICGVPIRCGYSRRRRARRSVAGTARVGVRKIAYIAALPTTAVPNGTRFIVAGDD